MHSTLPLLALSLLGALTLPATSLAQQVAGLVPADSLVDRLPLPAMAQANPAERSASALADQLPLPASTPASPADSVADPLPLPAIAQASAAEHPAASDSLTEAVSELAALAATPEQEPAAAPVVAKTLSGNVVDEWGNPLAGAIVTVLGEQPQAVSTNADGDYVLPATREVALVVRVSFGGYHDTERIARGPADTLFMLEPIEDYRRDLKKRGKVTAKVWKR